MVQVNIKAYQGPDEATSEVLVQPAVNGVAPLAVMLDRALGPLEKVLPGAVRFVSQLLGDHQTDFLGQFLPVVRTVPGPAHSELFYLGFEFFQDGPDSPDPGRDRGIGEWGWPRRT